MFPELGRIGPIVLRSYTLLLDAAILISLAILAYRGRKIEEKPAVWIDSGLIALLTGLILGRIGHVAIHWPYFANHTSEIIQIWRGGIDWHGAILGGLLVLWIISVSRRLIFKQIADELALILPIAALMVYGGCLTTRCGHGREVDSLNAYPPLIVRELPDLYGVIAPRLASQFYGIALSISLLILSLWLAKASRRRGGRFWVILLLLATGTFLIGYTRGDAAPMIGRLRLDQVFDLVVAGVSVMGIAITGRLRRPKMRITQIAGPPRIRRRKRFSEDRTEYDLSD